MTDQITECFDPRLVGDAEILIAAPIQDNAPLFPSSSGEGRRQRSFANSRLPAEHSYLLTPLLGVLPGILKLLKLSTTSYKHAP